MPPKEYHGRYTEVYFPSEKFLEKWKAHAKDARCHKAPGFLQQSRKLSMMQLSHPRRS